MNFQRSALLCLLSLTILGCSNAKNNGDSGGNGGNGGAASAKVLTGYMPEGAVAPEPATIESGAYTPLSRPLFLYVNKEALKRPEVVAYLNYYISEEGQKLLREVGYVRASTETFENTKKILADAVAEAGTQVPDKVSGEINIDGSSTVYPVSQAVTEEFNKIHKDVKVPVSKSGTSGGMKRFYASEIDIADASRAIKQVEIDKCKEAGIEYIELKIGIDGLTVVVNSENDWVDGLTVEELKKIWEPNSSVKLWSDVNPDFPEEEIALYGADSDSGTFDYFTEEICGEKGATRSDYNQNSDDNFLVTGVSGDKYALGYFGYAYFAENKETLKALAIAPSASE